MSKVDDIIDRVIKAEADYVDHPSDRGGPTRYGITQARARLEGYMGDMRNLPRDLARQIYYKRYVTEPNFDMIVDIEPVIGEELIDTGVNMGPSVAATFFQRWLNGFNLRGKLYADLFVDGRIGLLSVSALKAYLRQRGGEGTLVMLAALNSIQGERYLELAEQNETQEDFLYGWMRERVMAQLRAAL